MYFPTSSVLIEFIIMALLDEKDSYGYEISQTIKLLSDIKESALYPILKRLEQSHYVTTYSQTFQGRKRKYYQITDLGRHHLTYLKREWLDYKYTLDGIIEGGMRG